MWWYQGAAVAGLTPTTTSGDTDPTRSSTFAYLRAHDQATLAFVLLFDGLDLAYTTSDESAAIQTALSTATGNRWSVVKPGLDYPGAISQRIDLFKPGFEIESLGLRILDSDDTLLSTFFRSADPTIAETELYQSVNSTALTIVAVNQTNGFAASGDAYLGLEKFGYTSKISSGFLGCTRGKNSLDWTSQGNAWEFGRPHYVADDAGVYGPNRPRITNAPVNHRGRRCDLYLCHKTPSGTWSVPFGAEGVNDAERVWAGRIYSWEETGDGWVTFDTVSCLDFLNTTILADQYRAEVKEGLYLTADLADFRVIFVKHVGTGVTTYKSSWATIPLPMGANYTHDEVSSAIGQKLLEFFNAVPGTPFPSTQRAHLARKSDNDGQLRYQFLIEDTAAVTTDNWEAFVYLNDAVLQLLGWDPGATNLEKTKTPNGYSVSYINLTSQGNTAGTATEFVSIAGGAPRRHVVRSNDSSGGFGSTLVMQSVVAGTFYSQNSMPGRLRRLGANGFLRIKDILYPVKYVDTTHFTFVGSTTQWLQLAQSLAVDDDENTDPVEATQVWREEGPLGEIFAKLLVSTGTYGYNEGGPVALDYFPRGMGAGIPATLIDADAIYELGRERYELRVNEPTPLGKILNEILEFKWKWLVFAQGRITTASMGEEFSSASSLVALTESNKARVGGAAEPVTEVTRVLHGSDMIINRMTLKYDRDLKGQSQNEVTINATASQTDHDKIQSRILDIGGIHETADVTAPSNAKSWARDVAATVISYLSRPLAAAERSYDYAVATRLYPGTRVSISDNRVVYPVTGTRGVSGLLGWVTDTSMDWRNGTGRCKIAFQPDRAGTRFGGLGPSGRVDETANTGGYTRGYDSSTKRLKLKQREYSVTGDTLKDVENFAATDVVRIIEIDPDNPHIPRTWTDTIASVDASGDALTLTTGLTGFPTTEGYFLVEYVPISSATATQKATRTFLAAEANLSTGNAARDAYLYGAAEAVPRRFTIDYTQEWRNFPTPLDDLGACLGAHGPVDLFHYANAAFSYTLKNYPFSQGVRFGEKTVSTSYVILLGPVWIPVFSQGRTYSIDMCVALQNSGSGLAADNGILRVVTSILPCDSTSAGIPFGNLRYRDGPSSSNLVEIPVSSATSGFQALQASLLPLVGPNGWGVTGCWVTVEGKTGNINDRLWIQSINIREKELA